MESSTFRRVILTLLVNGSLSTFSEFNDVLFSCSCNFTFRIKVSILTSWFSRSMFAIMEGRVPYGCYELWSIHTRWCWDKKVLTHKLVTMSKKKSNFGVAIKTWRSHRQWMVKCKTNNFDNFLQRWFTTMSQFCQLFIPCSNEYIK